MATFASHAIAVPLSTLVCGSVDSIESPVTIHHVGGAVSPVVETHAVCMCRPGIFYEQLCRIFSFFPATGFNDPLGHAAFVACEPCCSDAKLASALFLVGSPTVYALMSTGDDLDSIFVPVATSMFPLPLSAFEIHLDWTTPSPHEARSYALLWWALGAVYEEAEALDDAFECGGPLPSDSLFSDLPHPVVSLLAAT